MKKKLTCKETIFVASMLFGMFFGAGNLIFPVSMGQMSGSHVWQAAAGFLITGVGLPLLSVAALGISRERGLLELASRAGAGYGLFFTCALYLTIGPLFAIPRCATVSYTVGIEALLPGVPAQLRPRRPRPALCVSAQATIPAGASWRARLFMTLCVVSASWKYRNLPKSGFSRRKYSTAVGASACTASMSPRR